MPAVDCWCGRLVQAEDDQELVRRLGEHVREAHPGEHDETDVDARVRERGYEPPTGERPGPTKGGRGLQLSMTRCGWVPEGDRLYAAYHDEEWGVPTHDERRLFELLVLEGAQAGLSWSTILRKREGYRRAFAAFDPEAIASFGEHDVERLLGDAGIVRNRLKVTSAIANARATLVVREEAGSLDTFLWSFVGGAPLVNGRRSLGEIPAETAESRAMSKELKRRGFRFVGPTICYALMQAAGLVNDHVVDCFRYEELAAVA